MPNIVVNWTGERKKNKILKISEVKTGNRFVAKSLMILYFRNLKYSTSSSQKQHEVYFTQIIVYEINGFSKSLVLRNIIIFPLGRSIALVTIGSS